MKINIWSKTKNRIVYSILYNNSKLAKKIISLTYYGPCYGIDKFINFADRSTEGYEYL